MRNLLTLDEQLNEASSAFKHAVQKALQAAGYNLKQSEVKVGTKKVRGMGTKITLNGEMIGFDDDIPKMIASFTKSIQEDPEKYGLKESLNEEKYKLEQLAGGEWIVVDSKGTELARERNRINAIKAKKDLEESVNEGSSNYSLLDFFKEMQSFPAAGVDSDDIKDASSPKNKKKTVKNTPALKGLLDQWMEGRYDEDPGYLVDELRDLLEKESVKFKNIQPLNEFGPMAGSNNRSWKTSDLVDRIGDLEDKLFNGNVRRAEKEWEMVSGQYLTGEEGSEYWADLDDDEVRSAIDDAEHIMKKYKMSESVNEGKGQDLATTYIAKLRKEFKKLNDNELEEFNETLANAFGYNYSKIKESVNEADQMHGEYLMQMLKAQADDIKRDEPKTAAALMYLWDRIHQSARDKDIDIEYVQDFLNEPRGRKHSQNLPEWMITDLFVESFIMKEELNEGEILVWDEMEKPFEDLKNKLDKLTKENTDPKWSKALLSVWKHIAQAEETLNHHDRKLGAIPIKEDVNEKKVQPNDETIKFHIDSYRVDDDPYDVAKEIGSQYNWTEKEIEKAEKIIRKKYLK